MARKDAAQVQAEVNSDEDWEEMLKKGGLTVVDVYCGWSGPCAAMVSLLRKIKMEIGGDMLHLAIANCDKIEALKRFRGNCEPTWLFISGGGLVNVMFGANAPLLRRLVVSELEIQAAVENGSMTRNTIPWDKLSYEEQKREDIRLALKRKKETEKEDMERAAMDRRLDRIGWALHNCTLLVYLPFTWDAAENKLPAHDEIVKLLEDDLFVRETIKIDLDPIVACELFFGGVPEVEVAAEPEVEPEAKSKVEVVAKSKAEVVAKSKAEVGAKSKAEVMAKSKAEVAAKSKMEVEAKSKVEVAVKAEVEGQEVEEGTRGPPQKLVEALAEGRTIVHYAEALKPNVEEDEEPPPPEDIILKVARVVYGCEAAKEGELQDIDPESVAARYARSELVPAVWTPTTAAKKMEALTRLFPQKMERFRQPPIPPHIAVAFEAKRYRELAPALHDNQDAILQLGFFSSNDSSTAVWVAGNYREFVLTTGKTGDEKLVLQLDTSKKVSLLNMSALGPCYFSLSAEEGIRDCEAFFPPKEETFEEEEEEEEGEEGAEGEEEEDEEALLAAAEAEMFGEEHHLLEAAEGEDEMQQEEGGEESAAEEGATVEGEEAPAIEGGEAPATEGEVEVPKPEYDAAPAVESPETGGGADAAAVAATSAAAVGAASVGAVAASQED